MCVCMCDSPLSLSSAEWQERESLWLETHFQSHLAHERSACVTHSSVALHAN